MKELGVCRLSDTELKSVAFREAGQLISRNKEEKLFSTTEGLTVSSFCAARVEALPSIKIVKSMSHAGALEEITGKDGVNGRETKTPDSSKLEASLVGGLHGIVVYVFYNVCMSFLGSQI